MPRFDDRTVGLPIAGEAHDDEAGQRRGFEIAAAVGLHRAQQVVSRAAHTVPQRACDRVARRREVMPHLPDRDERRQRVAHDRQPQVLKPGVGKRRQLERQLRNRSPAARASSPSLPASASTVRIGTENVRSFP